jgi:hypothetical protein
MDKSIERLEQLNRVLRHEERGNIQMGNWSSCAIGLARRDEYFVKDFNVGFEKSLTSSPLDFLNNYFSLNSEQSRSLFLASGYHDLGRQTTPSDVVSKIEVILMSKRAALPLIEESRPQDHLEFVE